MPTAGILRSQVANIEVDVLKAEAHNLSCQVAQYPVESGKTIADHVILSPNAVDIRFEMVNSDDGGKRARKVFQEFVSMRDRREPVELVTWHGKYKNMVVASFTPEHRSPYRGALACAVRLQQVGVIGESDMVSAAGGRPEGVLVGGGAEKSASGAVDGGCQRAIDNPALTRQCLLA